MFSDLSWQDNHENFFLIAAQHMLYKGPSRADQDYCEEQKTTLKHKLLWKIVSCCLEFEQKLRHLSKDLEKMGDVVQDGPGLLMYAICSNFSVVHLTRASCILNVLVES